MEGTEATKRPEILPEPPFIDVPGVANFRDLGGYAIVQSHPSSIVRYIRRGYIYRCGELSGLDAEGIDVLRSLGITHVFDLRSNVEIERSVASGRRGVVTWQPCTRVFAPVFTDKDYSPQSVAIRFRNYAREGTEGFTLAYDDVLKHAPSSFRQILLHIATESSNPFVVHCTAGKDRTGMLCALILSLCGVDDQTVASEYALTEVGLREWKKGAVKELVRKPHPGLDEQGAANMLSAKKENMLATLEMLRDRYHGAEGYVLSQCGLSLHDLKNIRSKLVVEESL